MWKRKADGAEGGKAGGEVWEQSRDSPSAEVGESLAYPDDRVPTVAAPQGSACPLEADQRRTGSGQSGPGHARQTHQERTHREVLSARPGTLRYVSYTLYITIYVNRVHNQAK